MRKKLTFEQLKEIENNSISRSPKAFVDSKPKPVKYWSLDDLARGKLFSLSFIKKAVKNANVRRQQHTFDGWKGWTKNKRMKSEWRGPVALYLQPEFQKKYFPEEADEHEKVKAIERLKRDYPIFCT